MRNGRINRVIRTVRHYTAVIMVASLLVIDPVSVVAGTEENILIQSHEDVTGEDILREESGQGLVTEQLSESEPVSATLEAGETIGEILKGDDTVLTASADKAAENTLSDPSA